MKSKTMWFFLGLIGILLFSKYILALPSAPQLTYVSNSTRAAGLENRSIDQKGTITTVTILATQQDYKWKAYVGNITGTLVLSDVNGQSIYKWNMSTSAGGEVYVSKYSNINWNNITCADQTSVTTEETSLGNVVTAADSINSTFIYTNHSSFDVAKVSMNNCRMTATYINNTAQTVNSSADFQEVLLKDAGTNNMIYATLMESGRAGYNDQNYDFQLIVAENESATVPTTYFFWVELG